MVSWFGGLTRTSFLLDRSTYFLSFLSRNFIFMSFVSFSLALCAQQCPVFFSLTDCRNHNSIIYLPQPCPRAVSTGSLSPGDTRVCTHTHTPLMLSGCSVSQKMKKMRSVFSLPSAGNQQTHISYCKGFVCCFRNHCLLVFPGCQAGCI